MSFAPSSDMKAVGRTLYLYSSLGLITHAFHLNLDRIPGLNIAVPKGTFFDIGGVLGIVVIFNTVVLILKLIGELSVHRAAVVASTYHEFGQARDLWSVGNVSIGHARLQPLVQLLRSKEARYRIIGHFFTVTGNLFEIFLPLIFGIATASYLYGPAWTLVRQISDYILGF